jgi:chromosome segregation ATPase
MRLILLDIAASGVENPKKALLVLDKHTKTRELIMLKEKYAVATTTHLEIRQKLSALVHDILAKYQEISDLKDDEDRLPKMDKLSDETENLIKETELWKEKAAETDEEVKGLEAEMDKYEQELEKLKEKFEELFGDSNLE